MNPTDPQLSSDQALESLLAQTRADMTERALGEMDRVSADLNNLLYRVRGTRRGASAAAASASAPRPTTRPLLTASDLEVLGVPASIAGLRPSGIDELIEFIPAARKLQAFPGGVIVVVGRVPMIGDAIQTAKRLAQRIPGPTDVVLGGAKTLTPGQGLRARSVEQLEEIIGEDDEATKVLVLADSPSPSHARICENLAEAAEPKQVWAVVSAKEDATDVDDWLWHLPGGLKATDLAVTEIWEAQRPAAVLGYSTTVGLLDLAPASAELWRIILTDRLRRDGWRG